MRARAWIRRSAVAALVAPLAALAAFHALDARYPFPVERLAAAPASPRLEARDGRPLREALASDEQWRRPLPLAEVSPWLVEATLAVEDRRFRAHCGVDPLAALRAAAQNVVGGEVVSGASTITMQVVKLTAPPRPRTLWTKAVEAFRAVQLERLRTKDEILELYFTLAPYGGNHVGAESAALELFGKHARDLSFDEAALLAGLPQSPGRYAPRRHAERALARRERVLDAVAREALVSAARAEEAAATELVLARAPRADRAPHFARVALARRPAGGRTTLDLDLQERVERLVAEHAAGLPAGSDVAVLVLALDDAAVRAWVGSADPDDPRDGQVDGVLAWRSPGSTLKPFVYAAAFEAGVLTPDSVLDDAPLELAGWAPENMDGGFSGAVTVREALRRSLNLPALRAMQRAGTARVLGVLETAGVRFRPGSAEGAGLALATGAAEVRLVDLVAAYATLGRDGDWRAPRFFEDEPVERRAALAPTTCAALHEILDTRGRLDAPRADAHHFCWKTGTSAGLRDAWTLGHDARHAVGVWVGRFSGAGDPAFVGQKAAAPLFVRVMELLDE